MNKRIFSIVISELSLGLLVLLGVVFTNISHAGSKLYFQAGEFNIQDLNQFAIKDYDYSSLHKTHPLIKNNFARTQKEDTKYFILQFANKITKTDQNKLKIYGIQVLRYVPEDAYIVRTSENNLKRLIYQSSGQIVSAPFVPEVRISSDLKLLNVFNRNSLKVLTVRVFQGVDTSIMANELMQIGVQVLSIGNSGLTVRAPLDKVAILARLEGVEWVAKKTELDLQHFRLSKKMMNELKNKNIDGTNLYIGDFTDLTGYESGTKIMNFKSAWEKGIKGSGQIVAIADTGLDTGNISTLSSDFSNLYQGYAWGLSSTVWNDTVGHGTHVAGSVAGSGATSNGVVLGGAYGSQIIVQSIWSDVFQTLTTPDDLGQLFQQAYDKGARIHTNSWGSRMNFGEYTTEAAQVDQYMWDNPDMLIMFAAGNSGVDDDNNGRIDPGSIVSPGTAKNVLTVGASENLVERGGLQVELGEIEFNPGNKPWDIEPIASDTLSNNPNGIAAFSSRGPTLDERIKPDLVAPGTNILSSCSHDPLAGELWGKYSHDLCFAGGTSMATPLTAGAAALVRQRLIDTQSIVEPSAALIKAILMHTAIDLYPGQFGEVGEANGQELLKRGPNANQGYGRVDVGNAIDQKLSLVDEKVGVSTGETKFYDITLPIKKITLVYTDAPATPNSAKTLVNDIDLEVHIAGQIFKSESTVNNSEQVMLNVDSASQGTSRVIVRGYNVPMGREGKQPYALVMTAE